MKNETLTNILLKIYEDDRFKLLAWPIYETLCIRHASKYANLTGTIAVNNINQLRIDDVFYNITNKNSLDFFMTNTGNHDKNGLAHANILRDSNIFPPEDFDLNDQNIKYFKGKKTILAQGIDNIREVLSKNISHKYKYAKAIKDFLSIENYEKLLYEYTASVAFTNGFTKTNKITLSSLNINSGCFLINAICVTESAYLNILKSFGFVIDKKSVKDEEDEKEINLEEKKETGPLTRKEKLRTIEFCKLLFDNATTEDQYNIFYKKNKMIYVNSRPYIIVYLRYMLLYKYKQNEILYDEIKKIIEDFFLQTSESRTALEVKIKNEYNSTFMKIGYYS